MRSIPISLFGVALTTLREAFRSKLFWVIVVFGAVALGALPLFPSVANEEKAKFIVTWSLAAATFVGAFSMIFLVAPAASRELEEKTLQQVLVKPIGRMAFCAGKILGNGAVSLLLFLGMGLFCYLALVSGWAGDLTGAPILSPSRLIEARSVEVFGKRIPSKDWEVKEWLSPEGKVVYDFSAFGEGLPSSGKCQILVALPATFTGEYQSFSEGQLLLENSLTQKKLRIPVVLDREEKTFPIDPEWVRGPLRVTVITPRGAIGIGGRKWPEALGVRFKIPGEGSFFWNLITAFLIRGLGVMLIASVAFLLSIRISGKLALVFAIVVFLAGLSPSYVGVMGRILRGEIELESATHHTHDSHEPAQEKHGPPGLGFSILANAADGLALVLPDLDRFDTGSDLIAGYNFGSYKGFRLLVYLGVYCLIVVLIGGFVLKARELA